MMVSRPSQADRIALGTKLAELEPQLASLSSALGEGARAGVVSQSEYRERLAAVQGLEARVARLRLVLSPDAETVRRDDLGLPELAGSTFDELLVCDHFLTERLALCRELHRYMGELFQWVVQATQGKGGQLKTRLRLLRLRWLKQALEREQTRQSHDERELDRAMLKLSESLRMTPEKRHLATNFDGLMKIFEELDGSSARIARLKSAITYETKKVEAMEAWLRDHDPKSPRDFPPPIAPPPVESPVTRRPEPLAPKLSRAEERFMMARQFVEQCMTEEARHAN